MAVVSAPWAAPGDGGYVPLPTQLHTAAELDVYVRDECKRWGLTRPPKELLRRLSTGCWGDRIHGGLHELVLDDVYLGAKGACVAFALIPKLPLLERVALNECGMYLSDAQQKMHASAGAVYGNDCIDALVAYASGHPSLKFIELRGNGIGTVGAKRLTQLAADTPSILGVDVTGNRVRLQEHTALTRQLAANLARAAAPSKAAFVPRPPGGAVGARGARPSQQPRAVPTPPEGAATRPVFSRGVRQASAGLTRKALPRPPDDAVEAEWDVLSAAQAGDAAPFHITETSLSSFPERLWAEVARGGLANAVAAQLVAEPCPPCSLPPYPRGQRPGPLRDSPAQRPKELSAPEVDDLPTAEPPIKETAAERAPAAVAQAPAATVPLGGLMALLKGGCGGHLGSVAKVVGFKAPPGPPEEEGARPQEAVGPGPEASPAPASRASLTSRNSQLFTPHLNVLLLGAQEGGSRQGQHRKSLEALASACAAVPRGKRAASTASGPAVSPPLQCARPSSATNSRAPCPRGPSPRGPSPRAPVPREGAPDLPAVPLRPATPQDGSAVELFFASSEDPASGSTLGGDLAATLAACRWESRRQDFVTAGDVQRGVWVVAHDTVSVGVAQPTRATQDARTTVLHTFKKYDLLPYSHLLRPHAQGRLADADGAHGDQWAAKNNAARFLDAFVSPGHHQWRGFDVATALPGPSARLYRLHDAYLPWLAEQLAGRFTALLPTLANVHWLQPAPWSALLELTHCCSVRTCAAGDPLPDTHAWFVISGTAGVAAGPACGPLDTVHLAACVEGEQVDACPPATCASSVKAAAVPVGVLRTFLETHGLVTMARQEVRAARIPLPAF